MSHALYDDALNPTAEEIEWRKEVPFRRVVGSLLHFSTQPRPALAPAVSITAKYQLKPGLIHWKWSKMFFSISLRHLITACCYQIKTKIQPFYVAPMLTGLKINRVENHAQEWSCQLIMIELFGRQNYSPLRRFQLRKPNLMGSFTPARILYGFQSF